MTILFEIFKKLYAKKYAADSLGRGVIFLLGVATGKFPILQQITRLTGWIEAAPIQFNGSQNK